MTTTIFTTRQDAFEYVATTIENGQANADEYDIDQIIDECFEYDPSEQALQKAGFHLTADGEEFWEAVERAAITEFPATFLEGAEEEMDENGPTGRTVLTLIIGVDGDEDGVVEIDAIQYVTDDPTAPEDLDELTVQAKDQGWKIISTPVDDNATYRVARI